MKAASSELHSGQRGNPDVVVIKNSIQGWGWGNGSVDKVPARQALGPKGDPQQQHKSWLEQCMGLGLADTAGSWGLPVQ